MLFIICILLSGCDQPQQAITANEQPSFKTAEFKPETHTKKHLINAFVNATDEAQIAFQASGRLQKQLVEIGDSVNQGDSLLSLYNPQLQPQIDDIKARLEANDAATGQIQKELDRNQSLKKIQAVSANRIDQLSSQLKQRQAEQNSLQAQLDKAQNMFQETTLKAPFAGIIADISKKSGAWVAAGEPIIQINGTVQLEAPVYLPAELIKKRHKGETIEVTFKSLALSAQIKEISHSAQPDTQLYKLLLKLPASAELHAGEKIDVTIEEDIDNIYKLPITAVIDNGINEPFIYTVENNTVVPKNIQIVDFYGDSVILDVINEQGKLKVVTLGQSALRPQQDISQP